MTDMQWLDGGITAVPGILASGMAAGIKPSGKKDLALIYSSAPARAAAVFTTNQDKGAPVLASPEHMRDRTALTLGAYWRSATGTTCVLRLADSHGNSSHLPKHHFMKPRTVSHE